MNYLRLTKSWILAFGALAIVLAQTTHAQTITLEAPPEGQFILDHAFMIEDQDEVQIQEACTKLLSEMAIPIVVVTIDRMSSFGGEGMRIETFAMLLFNQWELGHKEWNGQYWNKGIMLLVSREDRVARIELGDGFGREKDAQSREIMETQIVSRFKSGEFSKGILHGVLALDKMARNEKLPKGPFPWKEALLVAGFIGLLVFTAVSLIRRGASGWAWLLWGAVFSILGYILYSALSGRGSSTSGGGFSGGSFGGGFSGGGGATGSW